MIVILLCYQTHLFSAEILLLNVHWASPFVNTLSYNVKVSNFSLAQWYDENSGVARSSMVNDVSSLIREKHLTLFYEVHDFDDFNYALKQACEPFAFRKVLLNLDFPDRLKEHDSKTDDDYKMFETSVV